MGGPQGGGRLRLSSHGLKVGVAIALGLAVVLTVGGALWLNRPFQAELGSYRTSLADRTEAQRHNIHQAVLALDGVVIEPGETFSFNETVGPRTPERGYREAPAFLERDLVTSIGGGICQVSSTVYNAAILSGLKIVERHPHFRRVASVPPGRDATVWYGMADLRFMNPLPHPVRLFIGTDHGKLQASLRGSGQHGAQVQIVIQPEQMSRPGEQTFSAFRIRSEGGDPRYQELLSRDTYRLH